MKRNLVSIFFCCMTSVPFFAKPAVDYVDPFICTRGDHGQLDPAATIPFGMIKVGPDTDPGNHSGYNYDASRIKGFSHNRIGGVGCKGAGGNLRILPWVGHVNSVVATFDKANEIASPAYYSVLFENKIQAELTATNYTAFHRYEFPASDSACIIFDLASSFGGMISYAKEGLSGDGFALTVSSKNVCHRGRYTVHYYVVCSKKAHIITDTLDRLIFHYNMEHDPQIELYVTASSISQHDAKQTWHQLSEGKTFEEVHEEGREKWDSLLSLIEIYGNQEYKTIFYTHLYHTLLNPVVSENSQNQFRATDGQVYSSEDYTHYDSWSMWDNFRNKFSLFALIIPDISSDIGHSLVDLFRYGKPVWSGYHEPVPTVRTEHTIVTLLDLYQRGVNDFDIGLAYGKLSAQIDNIKASSPDEKLEKAYDYWALSEIAGLLGKPEDSLLFQNKAMGYQYTWKKYFSEMDDESDVMHAKGLYEGTIWQYRWHVQFDIDGLVELFGGIDPYTEQLEYFFNNHLYNHGNQPDIHVPFMFNYSTKPWLTQKWVNHILTKEMYQYYGTHTKWETPYYGRIYKNQPDGYIPEMDDDDGTMAAWYVLSSMGLYPVEVGKPEFQLSAPIFDRVVLHLNNGNIFEIITKNRSDQRYYIDRLTLNGKEMEDLFIRHKEILKGGRLVVELSDKPNTELGKKE